MSTAAQRSAATRAKNNDVKRLALIEDIEWLIKCQVGEAAILHSTGYTDKPDALQRLLRRAGRHELIPRVFEWQAEYEARHHPRKAA